MIINVEDFPNIFAAMECIDDDTKGTGAIRVPVREVPDRWKSHLENINLTLGRLSRTERSPEAEPLPAHVKPNAFLDSEFYAFCNGEFHEMSAIANRDLNYTEAYVFLADYFEDWSMTGDSPREQPTNIVRQRRLEWLDSVGSESGLGLSSEQSAERDQLRRAVI